MKYKRHSAIIEIINNENIETQDELIAKLKENGYSVTQATVSRDIRELGLVKVSTKNNRYKYALPTTTETDDKSVFSVKYRNIMRETVRRVDYAQNLVVIGTYSGMANAAAAAIDGMGWEDTVGTIAGDDTILVVMRTTEKAAEFADRIKYTLDENNPA